MIVVRCLETLIEIAENMKQQLLERWHLVEFESGDSRVCLIRFISLIIEFIVWMT